MQFQGRLSVVWNVATSWGRGVPEAEPRGPSEGCHHSVLPSAYSEFSVSWLKGKEKARSQKPVPHSASNLSLIIACLFVRLTPSDWSSSRASAICLITCLQGRHEIDVHEYDWTGSPARLRLVEGCGALLSVHGCFLLLPLRHCLCIVGVFIIAFISTWFSRETL